MPFQQKQFKPITAFGRTKKFDDWLRDSRCQVDRDDLLSRLRRGWHFEKALSQRKRRPPTTVPPGKSEYRGVCYHRRKRRWVAQIKHEGRNFTLGYFVDDAEAALAYDARARELKGKAAVLNFPRRRRDFAKR